MQTRLLADSVSVGDLAFTMEFGELQGVIDGLLGGGELGDVFNEILNMLGADLFNSVLQMAADDIAVLIQGFLNQMLEVCLLSAIHSRRIFPPFLFFPRRTKILSHLSFERPPIPVKNSFARSTSFVF